MSSQKIPEKNQYAFRHSRKLSVYMFNNPSFNQERAIIRMHRKEFQKLLEKYQKGLCTAEEAALIENWFTAMGSSGDVVPEASERSEIRDRSWARVRNHIGQSKIQPPGRRSLQIQSYPWTIAAVFLLLMVSAVYLIIVPRHNGELISAVQRGDKTIVNDGEKVLDVTLADGSNVQLQPRSSISFDEQFDGPQRLVELEGEAFFEVSKDALRPFLVNTNEVVTKVLGTTFSVSAFPDEEDITVSVMTGKVSVMTKKDGRATSIQLEETVLTPNQKIVYNKTKHVVSRAIVNEPVPIPSAGVAKRMDFEAAPIKEIFEGLEEVYGIDIEFDEEIFSSCILTTSISEGSIHKRLDMICKAIDAQYVINENKIVVSGSGCNKK